MRQLVLTKIDRTIKRAFDLFFSSFGLVFFCPIILLGYIVSSLDTRSSGFFIQDRVGLQGRIFKVIKLKTMRPVLGIDTSVTSSGDPRITKIGALLRKYKLDELPQLLNVFLGHMSFVGPRPDVQGFADKLKGEERAILLIRPGITGPATIKYKNEEFILSEQNNPEEYNANVIFPDKVQINLNYIKEWSLLKDINYIFNTIF